MSDRKPPFKRDITERLLQATEDTWNQGLLLREAREEINRLRCRVNELTGEVANYRILARRHIR